ncbi:MAG: FAD-dependent oxidoreductase [Bacillota bacterium]
MYDAAIIGAGIIGTAVARELAKYNLNLILLEKDSDVANGTTKANSAIIHAGFDPKPGTFKAKFNVEGSRIYDQFCRELDVPFKRTGSLVIAFSDEEMETLDELFKQGSSYEIPGLEILRREKLHRMEPGLNEDACGALYAPTAGVTDPYLLTIALAENAALNGVAIWRDCPVTGIEKAGDIYKLDCNGETVAARYVVNAAGLYADHINEMVNPPSFKIKPTRGEYFLLDKGTGSYANYVLFPCPTRLGKGVLVSTTVHGNLIVGPNAETVDSKEATETTAAGLAEVRKNAEKIKKALPFDKVITTFSGLRAKTGAGDFIIGESQHSPGFINVAGIESPGLASAPAIARYVAELVIDKAGKPAKKSIFYPAAKSHKLFIDLDNREKEELINKDDRFGRVVCRCESITEGEIVRAIESPVGARTLDGIKKRTRPGGGRCQGGFCGPRVIQILARELGVTPPEIKKNNPGSYILTEPTKSKMAKGQDTGSTAGSETAQKSNPPEDEKKDDSCNLVIIGGGPAGMAAALAARERGIEDILVIERAKELGGILEQCIHNGFGLHQFKEELTGPEYAERFIDRLKEENIRCKLDTMVLSVSEDRKITYVNSKDGLRTIEAGAVILAMGCRERTRGSIGTPGTRPAGIFSAGTAQQFVNLQGYMVGKKVVVFGSGDIGLIMARRIVWEGGRVEAIIERKPYSEGLVRNYVQCVEDYGIPMLLEHTIVDIKGKERVEGITIAKTDANKQPVAGTERELECDTILFSRGLIPENELSKSAGVTLHPATGGPVVNEAMETEVEGIFACGNVVHVHDLVDWVTEESYKAGWGAAEYIKRKEKEAAGEKIDPGFICSTKPGEGIKYIVPHKIRPAHMDGSIELYMRAEGHHEGVDLQIKADKQLIKSMKKKVLSPGEMIVAKLKKEDLPEEGFNEILVELEKGERNQ